MKIVGPIVLATHDWSRPKAGEPRMFDQAFLEWFTKVHPVVLPATAQGSGRYVIAAYQWRLLPGVGHFPHREVPDVPRIRDSPLLVPFRAERQSRGHVRVLIHGTPRVSEDHRRWVMPPTVSVPIALALYFGFRLVLGPYVNPIGSGVAIGYLVYDLTHYFIHRGPLKSRAGRFLRTHHMQHHYATPERRFGVSTPFWDYVFRTHR
jgi:hypothetical protein